MELYNTEDETNHHGFAVKIQPSIGEIEVTVKYKWVGWALLGIFQTLGNIDNLTRWGSKDCLGQEWEKNDGDNLMMDWWIFSNSEFKVSNETGEKGGMSNAKKVKWLKMCGKISLAWIRIKSVLQRRNWFQHCSWYLAPSTGLLGFSATLTCMQLINHKKRIISTNSSTATHHHTTTPPHQPHHRTTTPPHQPHHQFGNVLWYNLLIII
jgi:hypothetical protein